MFDSIKQKIKKRNRKCEVREKEKKKNVIELLLWLCSLQCSVIIVTPRQLIRPPSNGCYER